MTKAKNIVGPQIRKLRYQKGLTQEMFAAPMFAPRLGIESRNVVEN